MVTVNLIADVYPVSWFGLESTNEIYKLILKTVKFVLQKLASTQCFASVIVYYLAVPFP